MRVFAKTSFRYNSVDYPYGWQDLPQATADTLIFAGLVSATDNFADNNNTQTITSFLSITDIPSKFNGQANIDNILYTIINGNIVAKAGDTCYLGAVANHTAISTNFYTGFYQLRGRTAHRASENITYLKLVYSNWGHNGSVETNVDTSATLQLSVEYPLGVFTPVLFSGNILGTIPAGGNLVSDFVKIAIPKNAIFALRHNYLSTNVDPTTGALVAAASTSGIAGYAVANYIPSGQPWSEGGNATAVGSVQKPDNCNATTTAYGAPNPVIRPSAILGYTSRPSLAICGDSIASGVYDIADTMCAPGWVERASPVGTINLSRNGEAVSAVSIANQYAKRAALLQYCTHVVTNYGTNDLYAGQTPAQIIANLLLFKSTWFAAKPYIVSTVLPVATSSASWTAADGSDQTTASYDANRQALNLLIRGGIATNVNTSLGFIDVDEIASISYSVGKWKCFGSSALALVSESAGIHPNMIGNKYIANKVNLSAFLF